MRFKELLIENLNNKELGKHYGRYLGFFLDKIQNSEPFELNAGIAASKKIMQQIGGNQIKINDPQGVKEILNRYFGQPNIPDVDSMQTNAAGVVIPVNGDPSKVLLKTDKGVEITISMLRKPPEFGSQKGFNTGQIAEGALGAAITARFIKREGQITADDVNAVLKALGTGQESGKNQASSFTGTSANDSIIFKLVLPRGDYNALVGGAKKGKMHPDMQGVINSATQFANSNTIDIALAKIVQDKGANKVVVDSDGASDQTGTKADLFLSIDEQKQNLLSLKAGDVKQFGQGSGFTYEKLDDFFKTTFGTSVPQQYKDELDGQDANAAFKIIHEVYASIAKQIQSELAGDSAPKEAAFIERLYKGIRFHATRNQDDVTMVILKKSPNAPGFKELQFGQPLRDAMEKYDLQVAYSTPGTGSAQVDIIGIPKAGGQPSKLLNVRGNFKSEGKGYVRNIVEMGPLLKEIAQIERNQQNVGNDGKDGG